MKALILLTIVLISTILPLLLTLLLMRIQERSRQAQPDDDSLASNPPRSSLHCCSMLALGISSPYSTSEVVAGFLLLALVTLSGPLAMCWAVRATLFPRWAVNKKSAANENTESGADASGECLDSLGVTEGETL